MAKEKAMLSTQQAAQQAGVAESTIRHAIKTNKLQARRFGLKTWMIAPDALATWQANRKMGRPPKTNA